MTQKRRNKPIQIALTEEQIANIIQEASRQRRNLSAESLEDRIAPSRFGLPIVPGSEGLIEDPNLPDDPNLPGEDATGSDSGGDPLGGGGDDPFEPNDPAGDDPNNPPIDPLNPPEDPLLPEHDPSLDGSEDHGIPFNHPNNPYDVLDPNHPWNLPDGSGGEHFVPPGPIDDTSAYFGEGAIPDEIPPEMGADVAWIWSDNPSDWETNMPHDLPPEVREEMMNQLHHIRDMINTAVETGADLPPAEELNEHRMNILRNLRG